MKRKKVVLAFGTFDIIHPGHISYLRQARALGDKLVVVIATDRNVWVIKGRKPLNGQMQRKEVVEAIRYVDSAFVGNEDDMIKSVEKTRPDVVALGYDQHPGSEELRKKFARRGIKAKIVRLKPCKEEIYKTARMRERLHRTK